MVIEPHLNLTQITGVVAFFAVAIAAARVALANRARRQHSARVWWLVGGVHLVLGVEVVVGARHGVHDWVNAVLHDGGLYPKHGAIQLVLLMVCVLWFVLGQAAARRWLRGMPQLAPHARRSVFVTEAVGALFLVESVSLHAIDQLLYASVGPVRAIAYLWGGTALVILASAWGEFYEK